VNYDIIDVADVDKRMLEIRRCHGKEGEVLCFLDGERNVIGLLKKKSIWYIVVRAIREKVRAMCTRYAKVPTSIDISAEIFKTDRRINEIQKWLDLDENSTSAWKKLAGDFFHWSYEKLESQKFTYASLNIKFPTHWQEFLLETNSTDVICAATASS
jgi:hypothetical protein